MAKRKEPKGVASMNPDNMVSGGLMDDFDGEVMKARFVVWDYEGKSNETLAVAITIKPDDDDEFTQHYSSGNPDSFTPSMDGDSVDEEGLYAKSIGGKEQLNNNTNWAHFTIAALDAGFPKNDLGAACDWVEGLYGHFNRVPQRKRSGIQVDAVGEDGRQRSSEILVITELKQATGRGVSASTGEGRNIRHAGGGSGVAAGGSDDGLDEKLLEILIGALAESDDGIAKTKLAGTVIKHFSGAEKAKAVKRVSSLEFLKELDGMVFDADSATLYLG